MVGIESEEGKELEGAAFNPDSFNELFENILLTLSQLSTDSTPQQQESQERSIRTGVTSRHFHVENSNSAASETDNSSNPTGTMTILPKKKTHKERSEQRDHRHHGASSSQSAGFSHAEFSQEAVRLGHPELDHRTGNLSDILHSHHHAASFQQQAPLSFPEMPNSEPYRQSLSDRSAVASSAASGRHERTLSSRKERPANQFELEAGCHGKKRCLSPSFSDKMFSSSSKQGAKATCGLPSHQGLYSPTNALLPSSSAQEESANSDENNSEDEYYGNITRKTFEDEEKFAKMIEKKGWCIKQMASDGACLFRAVADQIYGDQEMHDEVRINCLNYMSQNEEHFSQYVTEDFAKYIARKRNGHCHGNHLEIQALAEVYNRPIEIYYYDIEPRNVFHGEYKTDYPPIRLSYHGNVHYNSIREPFSATVGIGLGLPEFKPGLAEKQQLSEALKRSEENQIEEAMLKDKMRDTDWDLMQAQIEDQIVQESYKDWMKVTYGASGGAAQANSASAACGGKRSPRATTGRPPQLSPPRGSPPSPPRRSPASPPRGSLPAPMPAPASPPMGATASTVSAAAAAASTSAFGPVASGVAPAHEPPPPQLQPASLADFLPAEMSGWDENAILAHALAQSTLHYYETLKGATGGGGSGSTGFRPGGASPRFFNDGQPGCSKHS